ncbi:MAG: DUF1573 domain-containing protein [Bacteroidales bacterium]|nr:DUF1573 domain-containing protein [Bacteroidales bacterium]
MNIRILFLAVITFMSIQIFSQQVAEISFDKTEHNYGEIPRKADGLSVFTLKNTGQKPVVITNVQTSCGCTATNWPKEPIMPGKEKTIEVLYDTKRLGFFSKTINVYNNSKTSPIVLTIKGNVIKETK